MSLVNDMLRDLDRRRQEPAKTAFGADRLLPVVDESRGTGSRSLVSFVLTILVTLALIMGALYVWQAFVVPASVVPPVYSPAATNTPQQVVAVPQADSAELAAVTQRMQELEAQNRVLLEDAQSAQVQRDTQQQIAAPSAETAVEVSTAISSADSSAMPTVSSSATAMNTPEPVSSAIAQAPVVASNSANDSVGLIRSPRTLSFAERDLQQVQDALRLAASNQNDQAIRQLRMFLNTNPAAHQSREMLVKLALQVGETAAAQTLLNEGLALDSSRVGFRKLEARILLGEGKASQAVAGLSMRAPSIDEDIEYHDLLATAYLSAQDYENAARSYEALVQKNRGEARWWYGLATAWDSLGKTRDAALAYEQATKLPDLSAALRQRSQQRIAEIGL